MRRRLAIFALVIVLVGPVLGPWSAHPAAAATDFSGYWVGSLTQPGAVFDFSLYLQQTGDQIRGNSRIATNVRGRTEYALMELAGSVAGDQLSLRETRIVSSVTFSYAWCTKLLQATYYPGTDSLAGGWSDPGCNAGQFAVGRGAMTFADLPAADPAAGPAAALGGRGIICGCDVGANPPLFCPGDPTLRAQMAALIARAMPGWQDEADANTFTDALPDAELWQRVGTLQHYGVVGGYTRATCLALGKAAPCFGPLDPVLRAQAIGFVARAMVAQGYWQPQPIDPALYGGALNGTGHEQDAATYWYYTRARGGVPDYPEGGRFPVAEVAPRGWFARLLWTALQGSPAAP